MGKMDQFAIHSGTAVNNGVAGMSTARNRRYRPTNFDYETLVMMSELNEGFKQFNKVNDMTLLDYLVDIAQEFQGEPWKENFENIVENLKGAILNPATQDEMKDVSTACFNNAFQEILTRASRVGPIQHKAPLNYMSFFLHRLGQPILPQVSVGWGHIREFKINN